MTSLIEKLKQIFGISGRSSEPGVIVLDASTLEQLMHVLSQTREDELSCEEVAERLDEYVECLAGYSTNNELDPLMEHHLSMCPDCHDAFEALLRAIQDAEAGA
jgi:septation ring formation regulator EzrA